MKILINELYKKPEWVFAYEKSWKINSDHYYV